MSSTMMIGSSHHFFRTFMSRHHFDALLRSDLASEIPDVPVGFRDVVRRRTGGKAAHAIRRDAISRSRSRCRYD